MPGQLVTIATFDLPTKARIAQNVLEKAGIKAVVTDEAIVTMDWLLGNAVGWVKVQVLDEDAERAVTALEESLGTGDEPVDQEALAAESVAGGERGEEDSAAREGETLKAGYSAAGSLPTEPENAPSSDHGELRRSERDDYARRLFLTSVFAVVVPPLWFYAIYLFLNAALGEGSLGERGRTDLLRGTAIMGGGLLVLFAFFLGARVMFE
jgi:hypothetical protein